MRIVGTSVCGPGEAGRYMVETLKEFRRLCDDVLICLNNGTDAERRLLEKFGFSYYEDDREWGVYQADIKENLHQKLNIKKPDLVLCLDMDERLDPKIERFDLEILTEDKDVFAWNFYIVDLWNDEAHWRPDMSFWKCQLYRHPSFVALNFDRGKFDPGLVPHAAASVANDVPIFLLHYGLMDPDARKQKVERYDRYDPKRERIARDYTEALMADLEPASFDGDKLFTQLQADVATRDYPKKK